MRRMCMICLPLILVATATSAQSTDFQWSGAIASGKAIEIKGVNGEIRAELASGTQVEVVATKRHGDWHRDSGRWRSEPSDPASVKIEVVPNDGNVTICAVYPTPAARTGTAGDRTRDNDARPNECRPGPDGRMNVASNDIVVDFLVKVPAGVQLRAKTVNGSIDARGLKSDTDVRTVNGKVFISTTGAANANTVNGSIEASVGSAGTQPLDFQTVNGSVTLRLPTGTNAELHAATSNGHFESEFPITVQNFSGRRRRVDGTMGSGGRRIELRTVNGSIRLQAN
jgi:hypothetical protein